MEEDIRAKSNKIKKIIKIVSTILYQLLVILCFIVTAVIVLQKVTASNKSIAGYRIFRVITGSMEPAYDVGEVVISKEVDPNSIKIGDDIVYLGTYGEYSGKIIMHDVIGIDKDENGNLNFHAKGLHSSSVEDPQIKAEQIYGVVKFKSKILTILYKLATNIYSLFVIIMILALNVFIAFRVTGKEDVKQLGDVLKDDDKELEDEEIEEDSEFEDELEADIDVETEDTDNEFDDDK